MNRFLIVAVVAVASIAIGTTTALAADVGQSGFYGQLDTKGYPQPRVIYRQPKSANRMPTSQPPVYMRVPPSHAKNWGKHCKKYNACGERVLFVQDNWYKRDYAPRYQEQNGNRGNNNNGNGEAHRSR
jgi:hypothetical protein